MSQPLDTKHAVSWLNSHTNRKVACAECGAKYSWRSIYFVRRHHQVTHNHDAGAWVTEAPIE
jgi:hypothetical protein